MYTDIDCTISNIILTELQIKQNTSKYEETKIKWEFLLKIKRNVEIMR